MSTLKVDIIQGKTTAGTVAMPAGMVVQTTFTSFNTATTLNSNSDADIGGSSLTFTPKFASSLLILSCSLSTNIYRGNTNQGGTVNFNVDGTNIDYPSDDFEVYYAIGSGTTNGYFRFHKEVSVSASNTNAKTIKLTGRPYSTSNSGALYINANNTFYSSIKIQEITQ